MNRFFSKLDLRDIKINPTGNSFPPDAEAHEDRDEIVDESPAEVVAESPAPAAVADPVEAAEAVDDVQDQGAAFEATSAGNGAGEVSDVLKVSARSRPSAVAGAIAGVVRELGRAEVQAIGAGATNQAVKAVAIAREYLRETDIEAVCLPSFIDVTIDNEDRTAILLVVEAR